MRTVAAFLLAAATLIGPAACSTYRGGYDYVPRPADVVLGEWSRVLVSIPGVRRGGKGVPEDAVELRLRFEHDGPGTLTVHGGGLRLTAGNLVSFGVPVLEPGPPLRVAAGEVIEVTAFFSLMWSVKFELILRMS